VSRFDRRGGRDRGHDGAPPAGGGGGKPGGRSGTDGLVYRASKETAELALRAARENLKRLLAAMAALEGAVDPHGPRDLVDSRAQAHEVDVIRRDVAELLAKAGREAVSVAPELRPQVAQLSVAVKAAESRADALLARRPPSHTNVNDALSAFLNDDPDTRARMATAEARDRDEWNETLDQAAGSAAAAGGDTFADPVAPAATAADEGGGDITSPLPDGARTRLEAAAGVGLGDVRVHTGPTANARTKAHGARALTTGRDIHVADGELSDSERGMHLLAHEAAHVAQGAGVAAKSRGVTSSGSAAELEADRFADAVVANVQPAPLRENLGGEIARKEETGEGPKEAPELPVGVPYRWIPGTYAVLVRRTWLTSAPDFQEGATWIVPSRSRELLLHLRSAGMLSWAPSDVLARAAERLAIRPGKGEVFTVHLGVSVFDTVGLPPGTQALVGRQGDGLEAVTAVPDVAGEAEDSFPLSAAHKQQLFDALERYTGMPIDPGIRSLIVASPLTGTLGAGTTHFVLDRAGCDEWFGADAYAAWLAKPRQPGFRSFEADAEAQAYGDLTPEEVARFQAWLAENMPSGGTAPMTLSRAVLDAIDRIDAHPERERILALLRGQGGETASESALEHAIQEAEFEAKRAHAGLDEPTERHPNGATPIYDTPLPVRVWQSADLVVSGESVTFTAVIDWPDVFVQDEPFSEHRWRWFQASVEWVFERTKADGTVDRQIQKPSVLDGDAALSTTHTFRLDSGEDEGTWMVTAFVRNSHFQPNCDTTRPVTVKTEEKRLAELREEAFADLGQADTADDDYDFETSFSNEAGGKHAYDHGKRFRGALPEDFERRTPEVRAAVLADEIASTEKLVEYLQKSMPGRHPEAIDAAEHYLKKLRETEKAIARDVKAGWQPFEIRGTYLGIGNSIPDGSLDLLGFVQVPSFAWQPVKVKVRDLSRRFEASNFEFEEEGRTFEQALELAFVKLCKEYPKGKVSILAEGLDERATKPTGQTIGFELDTQTWGEDVKEKVFDPAVSIAVNVASAMVMIFAPATIPVLMPATIAYNEAQNLDELVRSWDNGTLTFEGGMLSVAQIGLDLIPLISRARALQTSTKAFWLLEGFDLFANGLVMSLQAKHAIEQLRDGDIQSVVAIYEDLVKLDKKYDRSDPRLAEEKAALTAQLDAGVEAVRGRTKEVIDEIILNYGLAVLPIRGAVLAERSLRTSRLGQLAADGSFHAQEGVEPQYDRARGRIVGDEARMDATTIGRLVAEQNEHMQAVADQLAERLGIPADRIELRPGEELAIWDDGKKLQVRYVPGVDPERALERWTAQLDSGGVVGGAHSHGDAREPGTRRPPPLDAVNEIATAAPRGPHMLVDAGELRDAHASWGTRGEPSQIHYDPATHTAYFDVAVGDGQQRKTTRVSAKLDRPITTAAQLVSSANRIVGSPLTSIDAGHAIMRDLTRHRFESLSTVGLEVSPGVTLDANVEFGLGRTSDGNYLVVRGEGAAVDWARLPGLEPVAHTHPSTKKNDLPTDEAGQRHVSLHRLLSDTPDPLIARDLVFPSAPDFGVMARLGLREHRVFTPYIYRDGFIMKRPMGDDSPRLEFVIRSSHEVGRIADGNKSVHRALVVAEIDGRVVLRAEVWAVEARTNEQSYLSLHEPEGMIPRAVATGSQVAHAQPSTPRERIVAELSGIPVVAKSERVIPPGAVADASLHGNTYYVAEADSIRMLDRLYQLPHVQVRDFKNGFVVRYKDAEWYFERLSADALEDYGVALRSVGRGRSDGTVNATDAGLELGLPPANAATIEIWAFRGVRTIDGRKKRNWTPEEENMVGGETEDEPLLWAGHVGISFDGGKTIYGLTPDTGEDSLATILEKLGEHHAYPGKVDDDTEVFERARRMADRFHWNTRPEWAAELVDPEVKQRVRSLVLQMKAGPHDLGYSFPLEQPENGQHFRTADGYPAENIANCAVFPDKIGVAIPEPSGQMRDYMPLFEEWANAPAPMDFRHGSGESPGESE